MDSRLTINQPLRKLIVNRFNLIYQAAIEKNDSKIKEILEASYHLFPPKEAEIKVHPLSIKIDRITPICQLAFMGDHESVNFLLNHGADKLEAIQGYLVAKDYERGHKLQAELRADEIKESTNMIWRVASLSVVDYETACKELNEVGMINLLNDDEVTLITKLFTYMGTMAGLAYKGVKRDLLTALTAKYIPLRLNYDELLLQNYAHGNHDLNVDMNDISINAHCAIFLGYAMDGNIEKMNELYKDLSLIQKSIVAYEILYGFYHSGYMHDPDILFYISSYLDSDAFQNRTRRLFDNNEIPRTFLDNKVTHHRLLRAKYQLNHYQICALFYFENIIWVLQGVQLVKENIINMDIFIKISSYLFNLPINETKGVYDKVKFKYLKDFIIDDVKKYTDGAANVVENFLDRLILFFNEAHKKSHPHYDRAESFMNACKQADNVAKIESLITSQFSLFAHNKITHEDSKLAHDQLYTNKENDNFTQAIVRHNQRVIGRY